MTSCKSQIDMYLDLTRINMDRIKNIIRQMRALRQACKILGIQDIIYYELAKLILYISTRRNDDFIRWKTFVAWKRAGFRRRLYTRFRLCTHRRKNRPRKMSFRVHVVVKFKAPLYTIESYSRKRLLSRRESKRLYDFVTSRAFEHKS